MKIPLVKARNVRSLAWDGIQFSLNRLNKHVNEKSLSEFKSFVEILSF